MRLEDRLLVWVEIAQGILTCAVLLDALSHDAIEYRVNWEIERWQARRKARRAVVVAEKSVVFEAYKVLEQGPE